MIMIAKLRTIIKGKHIPVKLIQTNKVINDKKKLPYKDFLKIFLWRNYRKNF